MSVVPITSRRRLVMDAIGCPVCGLEACEDVSHLPPELQPADAPRTPRLRALRAADVMDTPRPAEIVEGIAWAGCLTVLAAESGAGKTFGLLDLAGAVSDGVTWHGRSVQPHSVVYVSYEGDALGLRLRALHAHAGRRLEHLSIIRASDPLSPLVSRDGESRSRGELDLTEAIDTLSADLAARQAPPIGLVILDTVRASLSGSEDSSEHVSAYLRAVRRLLARVPSAAAILVHHAGWQDGEQRRQRERGSSAWRGNCDATLYLEAGDYDADHGTCPLTLRAVKVRDAERPAPLHLIRRRVELPERAGDDLRRGPVTSCIVESDRRTRADRQAAQAQATAATDHALDLCVLRVMHEHAAVARSRDTIRAHVGASSPLVQASIARILQAGWAEPPARQRHPYRLTTAGHALLSTTQTGVRPSQTESDSTQPDTDYDPPPYRGGRSRSQCRSRNRGGARESDRESESDSELRGAAYE